MSDASDEVICLRRLTFDDVDEWLAGEDAEQIKRFQFPRAATLADVERAITRWSESWRNNEPVRQWGVCVRSSGALAGGVELRRLNEDEVNLSYVVFPAWRRLGIATRASRLALSCGSSLLGVSRVVIRILEGNTASLGVARTLGAVEVGSEPSEAGGRFIVFRLDLPAVGAP